MMRQAGDAQPRSAAVRLFLVILAIICRIGCGEENAGLYPRDMRTGVYLYVESDIVQKVVNKCSCIRRGLMRGIPVEGALLY